MGNSGEGVGTGQRVMGNEVLCTNGFICLFGQVPFFVYVLEMNNETVMKSVGGINHHVFTKFGGFETCLSMKYL